jgi:taurine dioxygenase
LTGAIGARVTGLNLHADIPGDVAQRIRDAFARHFVLVFQSDAAVGEEEQNRLASLFGAPQPLAVFQFLGALHPAVTLNPGSRIAKTQVHSAPKGHELPATPWSQELRDLGLGSDFDGWHTDSSFTPWLPRVAVLRAEVIPPVGGDTCFTSLCAAYDALSPRMQRWAGELTAVHAQPAGYKDGLNLNQYGADAVAAFDDEFPPREWPVVIEHPENGRRALFVNPGYTVHIPGLQRLESNAVLRLMFAHLSSASFVYRHHWHPNDLVLWDELTVLHRAPNDYGSHPRRVVRVTAGRVVPTAPS